MPETILVTGGAGFIGNCFVRQWERNNPHDEIVVLDTLTYAGRESNLSGTRARLIRADVAESALVEHLLDEHNIRTVVHFAAESHVARSIDDPSVFVGTNVLGTFSLLRAARAAWANVQGARFVQVSTDEVYGSLELDAPRFTEQTAYAPRSPYSASKAAADHLVNAFHCTYGLPTIVTHCSNNYGPRQHDEKFVQIVIRSAVRGDPIPLHGDGLGVRDWVHVEDHCRAIALVLERGKVGERYNIGGENERSNVELAGVLCDVVDRKLGRQDGTSRALITFVPDRPGRDRRYALDVSKIRALGWRPLVGFEAGIDATVDWYLDAMNWGGNAA